MANFEVRPATGVPAKQVDAVAALADAGADLNRPKDDHYAPLHLAAFYGHAIVAETLARRGADVDKVTPDGWAPVHIASQRGHAADVAALREAGADLAPRRYPAAPAPAFLARQFGHHAALKELAAGGVPTGGPAEDAPEASAFFAALARRRRANLTRRSCYVLQEDDARL